MIFGNFYNIIKFISRTLQLKNMYSYFTNINLQITHISLFFVFELK